MHSVLQLLHVKWNELLEKIKVCCNTQDSELCSQGAMVTCFSKALQYLIYVKTVRAGAKHLYFYLLRLIYSQDSGFESVAFQQTLVCLPVFWHSALPGLVWGNLFTAVLVGFGAAVSGIKAHRSIWTEEESPSLIWVKVLQGKFFLLLLLVKEEEINKSS